MEIKIKFVIWWVFGNPEIVNTWAKVFRKSNKHYVIYFPDGSFDTDCIFDSKNRFFVGAL